MRLPSRLLVAIVVSAACSPGDKAASAPGDSGSGGDSSAVVDSADSADSADTADDLQPVTLTGRVDWPDNATPDALLGLAATHTTWQADTVVFGSTLAGAEVAADGTFSLELPARPPAADLQHPAPTDHPELQGALYMLTAFVPTATGTLHFSEGRPIRGMAFHRLLVWFDPDTLGDSGWPGGWTLVDTGLEGSYNPPACLVGTTQPLMWRWSDGYPHVYGLDDAELVVPLRGAEVPLTLSGRVEGSLGGVDRLAGIPQQVALGETTSLDPVLDVSLAGGTFSATLTDAPPATHHLSGESGWDVTLAYVLQYADDGDGQWTLGGDAASTITRSACHDGVPTYLRYTRDVDTWRGMRLLECQGGQVGWRLLTLDETGATYRALDDTESTDLVVSAGCRF